MGRRGRPGRSKRPQHGEGGQGTVGGLTGGAVLIRLVPHRENPLQVPWKLLGKDGGVLLNVLDVGQLQGLQTPETKRLHWASGHHSHSHALPVQVQPSHLAGSLWVPKVKQRLGSRHFSIRLGSPALPQFSHGAGAVLLGRILDFTAHPRSHCPALSSLGREQDAAPRGVNQGMVDLCVCVCVCSFCHSA